MGRLLKQFDLTGKSALVTGGGSGMGSVFSRILAEAGATVMLAARNEERLRNTADAIAGDTGSRVLYKSIDLGEREAADELVQCAQAEMGGLDILIGNHGIDITSSCYRVDFADYDKLIAINLTSNIALTRAAVPIMLEKGWGRIIYNTSTLAQTAMRNAPLSHYAATKSGLEGFARFAAVELGTSGITVNCIAPGYIKTEMADNAWAKLGLSAEQAAVMESYASAACSLNRMGQPEELSGMVLLLASNAGSYINGQSIAIDGGMGIMGDSITPPHIDLNCPSPL